jgi:hypothetical protein
VGSSSAGNSAPMKPMAPAVTPVITPLIKPMS